MSEDEKVRTDSFGETPEAQDTQRITATMDVIRLLEDIQREHRPVVLVLPRGSKVVTILLDVDEASGQFVYDVGRNHAETQAILSAGRMRCTAQIRGVSVHFAAVAPVETVFAGAPAFSSPLPSEMLYLQRRRHYRANVRLTRHYPCIIRSADENELSLNIQNISLGGVRLQSNTVSPDKLPIGSLLQRARLDFLELGALEVTIRVVSHWKSENEGIRNYLYGCQFQQLPQGQDTAVQRLVFALERLDRLNTLPI
jgi:flagellar brake protein